MRRLQSLNPILSLVLTAAPAMIACSVGGGSSSGGGFEGEDEGAEPEPQPSSGGEPAANEPDVDTVGGDVALPTGDPLVTVLGIDLDGLDEGAEPPWSFEEEGLFCGASNMHVVVEARNFTTEEFILLVKTKSSELVFPEVEPTVYEGEDFVDHYVFSIGGAAILDAIDAVHATLDEESLANDDSFEVGAAVLLDKVIVDKEVPPDDDAPEGTEPTIEQVIEVDWSKDKGLIHYLKVKLDEEPPSEGILVEPDLDTTIPSMSGPSAFKGSATDNGKISHIELEFVFQPDQDQPEGTALTEFVKTIEAGPDDGKTMNFDQAVDVSSFQTGFYDLRVKAVDVCGHEAPFQLRFDEDLSEVEQQITTVKVIAFPFIRAARPSVLPGQPVITDLKVVHWDAPEVDPETDEELDYPDLLVATFDGVYLLLNEGLASPGTLDVNKALQLTGGQTSFVDALDADSDGLLDIVAVENLQGSLALVLYIQQASSGILLYKEHHAFLTDEEAANGIAVPEIRAIVVADFTGDDLHEVDGEPSEVRDDIAVLTADTAKSILLFKRISTQVPVDQAFQEELCDESKLEFNAEPEESDEPPPGEGPGEEPGADAAGGADAAAESADAATAKTEYVECDDYFTAYVPAGSVEKVTKAVAVDVTGDDGVPDGYLDLVVAGEGRNQITVFRNVWDLQDPRDTSFGDPTVSHPWPIPNQNTQDVQQFCLANFVELSEDDVEANDMDFDHLDVVAGTEQSSTWRIGLGVGFGQFDATGQVVIDGDEGPELRVESMSGTTNPGVSGVICDDFDGDGLMDFTIMSDDARMLEVHLGNGRGRFNQPEASPFLNPANEGIGFVTGFGAKNLRSADLDLDGYPELIFDLGKAGIVVVRNLTTEDKPFDLQAARALVTPLGKGGAATGGQLANFAVGDVTGDEYPEIVAATTGGPMSSSQWLKAYHPIAYDYRRFTRSFEDTEPGGESFLGNKTSASPTVFVWTPGVYHPRLPGYPASYDRMPKSVYNLALHGPVTPKQILIADLFDPGDPTGASGDGRNDLILIGGGSGTPQTHIAVYMNLAEGGLVDGDGDPQPDEPGGFWALDSLELYDGATFAPYNGHYSLPSEPQSGVLMASDIDGGGKPSLYLSANTEAHENCQTGYTIPPTLRRCGWAEHLTQGGGVFEYWKCWADDPFFSCDIEEIEDHKVGGNVERIIKFVDLPEPDEEDPIGCALGATDDDPLTAGDLAVLSRSTGTLEIFRYSESEGTADFPFDPKLSITKKIGDNPKDISFGELDQLGGGSGEGDLVFQDFTATVAADVAVAFGKKDCSLKDPFKAPLSVDPKTEQKGGVHSSIIRDMNADGYQDVVFTEQGSGFVTIYLAVGPDPNAEYSSQFHGPIQLPTCSQPTQVESYDFDADGCETVLVLCEGAGAVAMYQDDTCKKNIALAAAEGGDE